MPKTQSSAPAQLKAETRERYSAALDGFLAEIRQDRTVLAAILCGSLAHDAVWAKSDIDLGLITVDDKSLLASGHLSINAAGVNVHAYLMTRTAFRKTVEGATHNSFIHSMLAKGRLLYTHDETIAALCSRLQDIGKRDTQIEQLRAAADVIRCLDKAHKWRITRGDLDYTALWILYAAAAAARLEIISRGLLADREVLPQALALNPPFFDLVYRQMLNSRKTAKNVGAALDALDAYLAERAATIGRPILDYLAEAGEARSATEIEAHFLRNYNLEGVLTLCEYLADERHIVKVSTPARITRRSNVSVQELAFVYIEN